MPKVIKIKKGLNINLLGNAEKIIKKADMAEKYAVKPTDFHGIRPKLTVKVGDKVKAGTPLFFDKFHPEVQFTAPVSGEVEAIVRGEKRKILEVVIKADAEIEYEQFDKIDLKESSREELVEGLQKAGLWTMVRQRPYSTIADAQDEPKAIFISGFDSAPLAPDMDFIVKENKEDFQRGIDTLSKLTKGKIHLSLNADYPAADTFANCKGVEIHRFTGPHPAGNVGIQISKIDPINKGDVVWYVTPQHVISIGKFIDKAVYNACKIIALTGSEVKNPLYYRIISGASIANLIKDNTAEGSHRYISGNVLTGTKITADGYLGHFDTQVTVIPEGDYYEFFGWAKIGFGKYSTSRSFWSWLTPGKKFQLDTNLHGGERAFVMSGEYEKVVPLDIYPVHLMKSILVEDIDQMEKLGIYEVDEEDFALCDFICTSKIDAQEIIRKGLDIMRKEMS